MDAASLGRIRFVAGGELRTFADLDLLAREILQTNGYSPPSTVVPSFEVTDEQIFVNVKYVQGVGQRFWYVKFTRNGEMDRWGTAIFTGFE